MPQITLKAARINAHLKQREAAKKLGISYQTLSKYESDPSDITQKMLDKMAEVYNMPKKFFFLETNSLLERNYNDE